MVCDLARFTFLDRFWISFPSRAVDLIEIPAHGVHGRDLFPCVDVVEMLWQLIGLDAFNRSFQSENRPSIYGAARLR